MKKLILILSLCLFSTIHYGQEFDNQLIDSLFVEWDKSDTPGCALGIIQEGNLVYSRGYGIADLEHDIPITPKSVFYIGSVSKQFVTFCILLLEEQGRIDLDDEIQKYLPDFPEYEAPLTIRHFIHHTSGVRDYLTLMYLKGRNYLDNADVDEVYELIKSQEELNFSPGEKYLYSNSCYFMLAMIIEKASGQSIREFATENIFKPLGMNNTLFYDDNRDLIKNRVFSYEPKNDGDGFNNLISRFDLVGSGGVYSSIEDLYLWDQNFYKNALGKGGQDIIDKMHEEGVLNNGKSSGYAFALQKGMYNGLRTVSHSGALAGFRAQLLRFPDQEFSVIILANRGDANPTGKAYQVADLFLSDQYVEREQMESKEEIQDIEIKEVEEFALEQCIGIYKIQPGITVTITIQNDSLHVLQGWNNVSYTIRSLGNNLYDIPRDPTVQFAFSDMKDNVAQMLIVNENGRITNCPRMEEVNISPTMLEAYAGIYYSKELDFNYELLLEGSGLKLKVANYDLQDLQVYEKDAFTIEGGLIRFERKDGKINGFQLDAGRVTNLKFQKVDD